MVRTLAIAVLLGTCAAGSPLQEDSAALQEALRDHDPEGPWHYNDPAAGFAEAKATGKPLLIVFR